ncbi:hypothetical protein GCM10022223_37050 [Kineosporia mesophila]|uniref:Uncharacterized protein n=2 Tax=Kineosporia mesophila TaxID=566012 RepID=A0ABP6ZSW7_9ACTN
MEERAIPILTPLINDKTRLISQEDQETIAHWTMKTATCYEQDDAGSAQLQKAQIRDVMSGRPSRWSTVWAARWADPSDVLLRHDVLHGYLPETMQLMGQWGRTHIGLGNGIALMAISANRPSNDFSQVSPKSPWQRIWPPSGTDITLRDEPFKRSDLDKLNADIALNAEA